MPLEKAGRFKELVTDVLKDYTILANKADGDHLLLWSMTPKWHWLYHLSDRSRLINPKVTSCMVDEDYAGQIKVIVASCATGTPMHKVPEKVAEKLTWCMHFNSAAK